MAKMKVHELAKELEIQSKDVLTYLNENGIEAKVANSSVDDAAIEMVKAHFGKKTAATKAEDVVKEQAEPGAVKAEPVKTTGEKEAKPTEAAEAPKKKKKIIIPGLKKDK